MKLYKLTDQDGYTRRCCKNEIKWSEGFCLELMKKDNPKLCSDNVIHAYKNLNLGLLLNPVHADIYNPLIWEAEGEVVVEDKEKVGCFSLTIIKKIETPYWYIDKEKRKRVAVTFVVKCAEAVLKVFEDKYPDDDSPRKVIEVVKEYLENPTSDINPYYVEKCGQRANSSARLSETGETFAAACTAKWAAYTTYTALYEDPTKLDLLDYAADTAINAVMADNALDLCLFADEAVKDVNG